MGDRRRADLNRLAFSKLRDQAFRSMLKVASDDGIFPIVVALRDDRVLDLVQQVRAAGGAANVVLPDRVDVISDPDCLSVIGMTVQGPFAVDGPGDCGVPTLRGDCTVGVFLERLHAELPSGGHYTYGVEIGGSGVGPGGKADLVTIAD